MIVTFLAIAAAQTAPLLDVPKATWEPIFFRSIDERAAASRLPSLRKRRIGRGDLELRLWEGFGLTQLEGVRLQRISGVWKASWIPPVGRAGVSLRTLPVGSEQLEQIWRKVRGYGILDLPDSESLPNQKLVLDGMSYVVEYQAGGRYRTYCYDNPDYQTRTREIRRILAIVQTIEGSLDLLGARKRLASDSPKAKKPRSRGND